MAGVILLQPSNSIWLGENEGVQGTPPSFTVQGYNDSQPVTVGSVISWLPQLSAGTAPITFSITGGAIPTGTSFNSSTGEISGTVNTIQTSSVTITASNGFLPNDSHTINFDIIAVPVNKPSIINNFRIQGFI